MTQLRLTRKPYNGGFTNLLDEFFADMPAFFQNNNNPATNGWTGVPVNIREGEQAYQLEVLAPGFEKSDFRVDLEENLLTITGEKKEENKEQSDKLIRREFQQRSFKRSFTLDDQIDAAGIDARYVNGVLTLNLPKKVEVKTPSKKIDIQ